MDPSEERNARNEAIFRDANNEIDAVRAQLTNLDGRTPYFCECEDPTCREIVRLEKDEYEAVRSSPFTFLVARGHPDSSGRVVAEHDSYVVVEKQGAAARVALETDPRRHEG